MYRINTNYQKLPGSYLFSTIARKIAAFTEANPDAEIKTMDVYVKPEEGVAYYAVNGEGSGDYKIEL